MIYQLILITILFLERIKRWIFGIVVREAQAPGLHTGMMLIDSLRLVDLSYDFDGELLRLTQRRKLHPLQSLHEPSCNLTETFFWIPREEKTLSFLLLLPNLSSQRSLRRGMNQKRVVKNDMRQEQPHKLAPAQYMLLLIVMCHAHPRSFMPKIDLNWALSK